MDDHYALLTIDFENGAWKYAYKNYLQMSSDGHCGQKKAVVLSIHDTNLIKIW